MNEQEAQKAAFKNWDYLNKNSLSIDHKNAHQQGWDDAIEWVKQGQEPFPGCAVYTDKYGEKRMVMGMEKGQEDRYGQRLYLHPASTPEVVELIEAAKKALEAFEWSWGGEPMPSLEFEAMGLLRKALSKAEVKI